MADRVVKFYDEFGVLAMRVEPRRGEPYVHRCPHATYLQVARALFAFPEPMPIQDLAARLDLPHSQVNVACAFMIDCGVAEYVGRRGIVLSGNNGPDDAIVEVLSLREEPAADPEQFARNAAVLNWEV